MEPTGYGSGARSSPGRGRWGRLRPGRLGGWWSHSLEFRFEFTEPKMPLELPKADIKQVLGFLANLSFKEPDSQYFWLCGPEDLLATTLPL